MRTVTADDPTIRGEQPPHRHRLTVEDYHRMTEVGVLTPHARVELIEGEIVDLAPRNDAQRRVVMRLDALLQQAVGGQAIVLCRTPLRLGVDCEPEPDLAVVRARPDAQPSERPARADALVLIEVSDTTWQRPRPQGAVLRAARCSGGVAVRTVPRHGPLSSAASPRIITRVRPPRTAPG